MDKKARGKGVVYFFVIMTVLIVGILAYALVLKPQTAVDVKVNNAPVSSGGASGVQCNQNPAYTYGAYDSFTTTTVVGTDSIKVGNAVPTNSLANPPFGSSLTYWKSNASNQCELKTDTVVCGSQLVQTKCYGNTTLNLKLFDSDNNVFLTNGGGVNVTIGANGISNLELRTQSNAKASYMPFGGCMAVEVPTTITDVSVSGQGVGGACPYTWTYTVGATTNTYKLFAVPAGYDKNGVGDLKKINIQLKAGSSNPAATTAKVTMIPANYYVGNDYTYHLGIEKDANADTTKTFDSGQSFTFTIE